MKYLKASIALLLFSSTYFSCKESPIKESEEEKIKEEQFHSIDFSLDSAIEKENVTGIYKGIFPCNDCDGMEQILFLKNNFTYKQAYVNVDSNKVYSTSTGEWKIEDNRIILSKGIDYYISFSQRNDSLFAVDIDRIKLKNPEMYALGKQEYAGDDLYWESEKKKGITFAGRGIEPSWALNIKNDIIYFKLLNTKTLLVSHKEKTESDDNEITYHLSTGNKNWTVTILNNFCKNGLSEGTYEYHVVVNYDGIEYSGCGIDLMNE